MLLAPRVSAVERMYSGVVPPMIRDGVAMSVKERLHQIIDELDDERAEAVLVLLTHAEQPRSDKGSTSVDDPLWQIVGMVGDEYEGPTDVSSNKYRYIAEHPEIKTD
jgi:hypothetical protein